MNPLLSDWGGASEGGLPPFSMVRAEHFEPAFHAAMAAQRAEFDSDERCNLLLVKTELTETDNADADRLDHLRALVVELRQPRNGALDRAQQIFLFAEPILGPVPQRAHRF